MNSSIETENDDLLGCLKLLDSSAQNLESEVFVPIWNDSGQYYQTSRGAC